MFKIKHIAFCFLVTSVLFIALPAHSAIINASSSSQSDVQAAVNSAKSGDTVIVPAGKATWSSGVNVSSNKITLQGAGIGKTIISVGDTTAVSIGTSGSRVTGFEFNLTDKSGIGVRASGMGWRVDHCEVDFTNAGGKGYAVLYSNRNRYYPDYKLGGLIDNCSFKNARVLVDGSAYAIHADATRYHSTPTNLGSEEAVYIEDCTFKSDQFGNLVDANRSGGYVIRFNTFSKTDQGGYVIEAHALQSDDSRGTKKWEIYHNKISHGNYATMLIRAGTGVIWGNSVNSPDDKRINLDSRRSYEVRGVGLCDGNYPDWDGNIGTGIEAGWPCRDQPGTGPDKNSHDGTLPLPVQMLEPAYNWFNRDESGAYLPVVVTSGSTNHIKPNRDFYDEVVSSFDGKNGVGIGKLADRPSNCTPGVGFWATDQGSWNKSGSGGQGVLYKCTSSNKWEAYYTPYEYPHPLRNGELPSDPEGPGDAPASPGKAWVE